MRDNKTDIRGRAYALAEDAPRKFRLGAKLAAYLRKLGIGSPSEREMLVAMVQTQKRGGETSAVDGVVEERRAAMAEKVTPEVECAIIDEVKARAFAIGQEIKAQDRRRWHDCDERCFEVFEFGGRWFKKCKRELAGSQFPDMEVVALK